MPGEVATGTPLNVTLVWFSHRGTVTANGAPILQWDSADNQMTQRLEYFGGQQPAPLRAGYTMRRYTLHAPAERGDYKLSLGWGQDAQTLSRARCMGSLRQATRCSLGTLHVGAANTGLANFDHQIVLLDADLDVDDVPAGGQTHITLQWRGLRTLSNDYTVFVQIVGPDGKLYGQADSWPVQGTSPTSQWLPGTEVADLYHLYLKADAPTGEYAVIVGWYLLADMHRLPVLNAEGETMGDFYTVGEFQIEE